MNRVIMTTMIAVFALSVQTLGQNLIVNGDFEDPLTFVKTGTNTEGGITRDIGYFEEITSEYVAMDPTFHGSWTLGPEYLYTVSTDPSLYHSAWTSFGDHTSGSGNMMIVNGTWDEETGDYEAVVWAQDVELPACVSSYALYAGQTWEIGEVLVKIQDGQVCVKFVITDEDAVAEGWLITEAHVAIGDEPADIPQKNGNPRPGRFPINDELDPGVTETDWYCLPYDGETIIAAHAALELPEIGHYEDGTYVVDRPYEDETGWGNGGDFPGKNWATYIFYEPCSTLYTLTFWAGNSYPGSVEYPAEPAILQVEIDGEVVDTLALEYTYPTAPTPGWMQFSYTWAVSAGTTATIQIRDTRYIMYGDDFVLDDIFLVEVAP